MNRIPSFIYGTAWKEGETERLTRRAIETGFRAIDTANQRKHYHEVGVGAAVAKTIADGVARREDLFLQTKFTYLRGQDNRLPYDPKASPTDQVRQSFASSLEHLQVDAIESYVLHGPSHAEGLDRTDLEVWRAMEELHNSGKTRHLGISNATLDQVAELWDFARVRPSFVQNRCYARDGWDRRVRAFCREKGIMYQGFSLLTANVRELQRPDFQRLAQRFGKTPAQILFRFAQQAGMLPLTGTTDVDHMREDLDIHDFELGEDDMRLVENIGVH